MLWAIFPSFLCFGLCVCVNHSVMSDSLQPHGLYSPPGSSVPGILQARILEWDAMPSSRVSSQARDQTQVSRIAGSLPSEPPGKPVFWSRRDFSFFRHLWKANFFFSSAIFFWEWLKKYVETDCSLLVREYLMHLGSVLDPVHTVQMGLQGPTCGKGLEVG